MLTGAEETMRRSGWRQRTFLLVAVGFSLSWAGAWAQRVRVDDGAMRAVLASASGTHGLQGYLGVDLREVPEGLVPKTPRGAEIIRIDHDGPAGKAGLREHDVVVGVNGQTIESAEPLRRILHDMAPGRALTLTIHRGGQQQTVSLQMGNREDVDREAWAVHIEPENAPPPAATDEHAERHGNSFISSSTRAGKNFIGGIVLSPAYTGAMLETMAPQLAEYFGAQGKAGLLVRSVDANSPAAVAGLRAGDVVVRVNAVSIATSGDWMRIVRDNKGKAVPVVVLRERREQTLTMTPNAKHHSSLLPDFWPHRASSFWSGATPERASASPPVLPR